MKLKLRSNDLTLWITQFSIITGITILLLMCLGYRGFPISFFHDDSFFYIKTAGNIAQGNGPTFDGVNITNGFHPLYILLLAAIGFIRPLNGPFGVFATVILDMVLFLAGLFICDVFLKRKNASFLTRILTSFFLFLIIGLADFGMEVRLLFPLAWLFVLQVDRYPDPTPKQILLIGFLGMLICMTRLEMLLFVGLVVVGCSVLTHFATGRWNRSIVQLALGLLPSIIFLVVYAGLNYVIFGHPTSISSSLKAGFPGTFATGWLGHAVFCTKARIALVVIASLSALVLCSFEFIKRRRRPSASDLSFVLLLAVLNTFNLLYIICMILMLRWGDGGWYFSLPLSIVVMTMATAFVWIRHRLPMEPILVRVLVPVCLFAFLLGSGFWGIGVAARKISKYNHGPKVDAILLSEWIREDLPADARIFQVDGSGFTGYYSERCVINGDGLINNYEYQEYLRSNRLQEYLQKKHVSYLIFNHYSKGKNFVVPIAGKYLCFPILPKLVYSRGKFALFRLYAEDIESSTIEEKYLP